MTGAPRIDAHHHTWDLAARAQPWTLDHPVLNRSFGMPELESELRRVRFTGSVVVQNLCEEAETVDHPVLNRSFGMPELESQLHRARFTGSVVVQNLCEEAETVDLLALAADSPTIRGVVGWVDLTGDVDLAIRRLRDGRGGGLLVGIRHQVQFETEDWLGETRVRAGLATLGRLGLAFDAVVRSEQLSSVLASAREVPTLRVVVDHLGYPARTVASVARWGAAMTALGALPTVAVKLSAITSWDGQICTIAEIEPFVQVVLDAFGPERVMFGSDWPVCLLTGSFDDVVARAEALTRHLDVSQRDEVFGATARRWYGLS